MLTKNRITLGKRFGLASLAMAVLSSSAFAGGYSGGGDATAQEFLTVGHQIETILKSWSGSGSFRLGTEEISLARFHEAVGSVQVLTQDRVCLRDHQEIACDKARPDEERDALNFPAEKVIKVGLNRWKEVWGQDDRKLGLVFHEFLGILGHNDEGYRLSNQFVNRLASAQQFRQTQTFVGSPSVRCRLNLALLACKENCGTVNYWRAGRTADATPMLVTGPEILGRIFLSKEFELTENQPIDYVWQYLDTSGMWVQDQDPSGVAKDAMARIRASQRLMVNLSMTRTAKGDVRVTGGVGEFYQAGLGSHIVWEPQGPGSAAVFSAASMSFLVRGADAELLKVLGTLECRW